MGKPVIISETPINIVQLKEELINIKKRDNEPNIRVGKTEEYLNAFVTLSPAKGKELFEKLTDLNVPRLKETHIHKMIDLIPADINDLKLILQGYALTVSNENMKKIIDAINSVIEKKV